MHSLFGRSRASMRVRSFRCVFLSVCCVSVFLVAALVKSPFPSSILLPTAAAVVDQPECEYPRIDSVPTPSWSTPANGPNDTLPSQHATILSPVTDTNVRSSILIRVTPVNNHTGIDLTRNEDTPNTTPLPSIWSPSQLSLSMWLFFRSFPSLGGAALFERVGINKSFSLIQINGGSGQFQWRDEAGVMCTHIIALRIATWHQIGLVIGSSTLTLYLDGARVGSCAATSTAWPHTSVKIPSADTIRFDMDIGRIDVWESALTDAHFSALATNPPTSVTFLQQYLSPSYGTIFHHTFAGVEGGPTYAAPSGVAGGRISGLGHSSHVLNLLDTRDTTLYGGADTTFPTNGINADLTIHTWIYGHSWSSSPHLFDMRRQWVGSDSVTYIADQLNFYVHSSGVLAFGASCDTAPTYASIDSTPLHLFRWYHVGVIVTSSPASVKFFVNGVPSSSFQPPPEPFFRMNVIRNYVDISHAHFTTPYSITIGSGLRFARLMVHNTTLNQSDMRRLALSMPVTIRPTPITIHIPTAMKLGSSFEIDVYLPFVMDQLLPLCVSPSVVLSVTLTGGGLITPSSLTFSTLTPYHQKFVLTFPSSASPRIVLSFVLSGVTDSLRLPFTTWTVTQLTAEDIHSTATVQTYFRTNTGVTNYTWTVGPSGVNDTGIAYLKDATKFVDLRDAKHLPDSPGVVPLTWGATQQWHGWSAAAWLQWNGPWCKAPTCALSSILLFSSSRADGGDLIRGLISSGDTSGTVQSGLQLQTRFDNTTTMQYVTSNDMSLPFGPSTWSHMLISVTSEGIVQLYINGTAIIEPTSATHMWPRMANRTIARSMTHDFGGSLASYHWWPRALSHAEATLLGSTSQRPASICFAPCVYSSSFWGTFFNQPSRFAGHYRHPDLNLTTGFAIFQTESDESTNSMTNPTLVFDLREARNFENGTIIPEMMIENEKDSNRAFAIASGETHMDTHT